MTNFIWITTEKEMFHCYPEAEEEVKFLRQIHRHIFKFKVYLEVFTDSRDIEFILFKKFINEEINKLNVNLLDKSCEMISNYLANGIKAKYPQRDIKIEVSEDGENGSEYYYTCC
jgi:hypothetical protein